MNKVIKQTLLLATLWVTVCAGAQNPPPAVSALPVGSARVTEMKGEVSFRGRDNSPLKVERGQTIDAETTIETAKGSVLLELADGSQVLVKNNSRVVLKNPQDSKGEYIRLLMGKLLAKVQKRLGNTPSFQMGTPTAVITVRGTRFSVEVNKKESTWVEVFDGLVEVSGIGAGMNGSPVMLNPGFATEVRHDRAPERPRHFSPEPNEGMQRGLDRNSDDRRFGSPGQGEGNQRDREPGEGTPSAPAPAPPPGTRDPGDGGPGSSF